MTSRGVWRGIAFAAGLVAGFITTTTMLWIVFRDL